VLAAASWGYAGQIADLARMPVLLGRALPWLRLDRRRVYAVGGSMGGQEALLLLARFPRLLAGVVVFDAPTDLAARYYALSHLRNGPYLQGLMRREIGASPEDAPLLYRERSPISSAARLAFSDVPIELWWSRSDGVVVNQSTQSGRLYRLIKTLNPRAPVWEEVGNWGHMAEMSARRALPAALRWLGILHASPSAGVAPGASSLARQGAACRRTDPRPLAYGWPVEPFDQAHAVRGNFGDPRTTFLGGLDGSGSFSYHDGVDIWAHVFARVYPVVSGRVTVEGATVVVRAPDDRRFEYAHLRVAVHTGTEASTGRTVLGYIQKPWRHVHLSEIDPIAVNGLPDSGYWVVDPLRHLTPYHEGTAPRLATVFARDLHGRRLPLLGLHGRVRLIADAYTLPAVPVPGVWHDMPVAPAVVRWRLLAQSGTVAIGWHTPVDFRRTIPPDRLFWRTYARGSYQNFPAIGERFYYGAAGRYLYILTPGGLDTRRLANGRYRIMVQAGDICGDTRTATFAIDIRNPTGRSTDWPQARSGELPTRGVAGFVSRIGDGGRFVVDGRPTFPIALAGPPPLGGRIASGADALNEVVSAGVNFFRVGPTARQWKLADIRSVEDWDRAAAARGVHTIVSLRGVSAASPGSRDAWLLLKIVRSLTSDSSSPGIGLWRGADEPLPAGIPARALRYVYCRVTSRGEPWWCAGERPLDPAHVWLTIQAPQGNPAALAPYSAVTDSNGVDVYPVAITNPTPDLHQVGTWTRTIASVTPNHATWTTLEICPRDTFDGLGHFRLPTPLQERYMIYDAIINGARGLGFFGGDNPHCWSRPDHRYGWNWAFWNNTLEPLLSEINTSSPLSPALTDPDSTRRLATNDATTQAISRTTHGIWVIAAHNGHETKTIRISGLPTNLPTATVYTEHRRIHLNHGQLTDRFHQWQVHIYHLTTARPHPGTQMLKRGQATGSDL
jgi:hypothetical protein